MAGPGIAIQISGNTQGVERMLEVLDTALNPFAIAEFLGVVVGPYLKERARARFASEGDDVVGKWAPLKDSTITIRESQGYGPGPINSRTGELEEFITGPGNSVQVHPWGATLTFPGTSPIGEMEEKLRTAQQGKDYPSTVPRPVLGVNEADLVFVLTALATHIEDNGRVLI